MAVRFDIVDIAKDESYITSEPVTLAEAKLQAYANDYDDDKILALITQARQWVENYCSIALVTKVISVTGFLKNRPTTKYSNYANVTQQFVEFELPFGPVGQIASITGTNQFDPGTAITLVANQDYFVYGTLYKRIRIINNFDSLNLIYYAGYPGAVPDQLKLALLNELAFRFEQRGDSVNRYASQNVGLSEGATSLAEQFIRRWWT